MNPTEPNIEITLFTAFGSFSYPSSSTTPEAAENELLDILTSEGNLLIIPAGLNERAGLLKSAIEGYHIHPIAESEIAKNVFEKRTNRGH